jgi:hypothetical protein
LKISTHLHSYVTSVQPVGQYIDEGQPQQKRHNRTSTKVQRKKTAMAGAMGNYKTMIDISEHKNTIITITIFVEQEYIFL